MLFLPIPIRTYTRGNDNQRFPGGCLGALLFYGSAVLVAWLLATFCSWSVEVDYGTYTGTFFDFLADAVRSFVCKLRRLW